MEDASSEGHKCPKCGAEVLGNAVGGLCPACLMAVQMGTQTHLTDDPTGAAGPKPKAASPEDIAEFFPQFEIIECLGRGGMGAVYKARQKSLNRLVALKILAPEREGDAAFAKRFAREAETLAKLNHPNIVTVHDFGDTNGMFYLVMEFVDGVNLRSLIHERKLSPEEALTIVPPICEALQFAHELGIVHRDIKPENLLLDKKGRVKIADFGIAKIMGTSSPHPTETGVGGSGETMDAATRSRIVGTPQYMAPEQGANPSMVDHRADIFSLGVVFYEMLTGTLPSRPIDPPSRKLQVDVRLDEVVLRALEESPERRFQTADIFKTEVETLATSLAGSSRREEAQTNLINERSNPTSTLADGWKTALRVLLHSLCVGLAVWFLFIGYAVIAATMLPKYFRGTAVIQVDRAAPSYSEAGLETTYWMLVSPEFPQKLTTYSEMDELWKDLRFEGETTEQAVERLRSDLSFRRVPLTRMIEVVYLNRSPDLAAAVANAVARGVIRDASIPGTRIWIVDEAVVPIRPVKPNMPFTFAFSLTGGALAGCIAAGVFACVMGGRKLHSHVFSQRGKGQTGASRREEAQTRSNPNLSFSRLSFGLLLCVLLGTPLLLAVFQRDELVLISSGLALLLAVVFGGLSWRHRLGKASAISATLVIIGFLVTVGILSEVIPVRSWTNAEEARRNTLRMEADLRRVEALAAAQATLESAEASAAAGGGFQAATAPPVVVSTSPISGDDSVDVSVTEITVTFSKPMLDRSWSFSQADDETAPELIGEPSFDADLRTCTVRVSLEPGRTYALWLNSENFQNFKDASGEPAIPYLLIFKTKVEP